MRRFLYGRFLRPVPCRRRNFSRSLSLQGGRIFTYYSTSAAERQSYLAAKFVSPQNAPLPHTKRIRFFHRGGVLHSTRGRKKYFKPAPPVCGGRGGPFCPIYACCGLRLRPSPRGGAFRPFFACKIRLFLHIFPMQGIKLPSTGQTIGEDPNGCAAELHMMI